MTEQTNNSSYWLDVANVAQQALAAAEDAWNAAYNDRSEQDRHMASKAICGARDLRDAAMHLRNALAIKEATDASN